MAGQPKFQFAFNQVSPNYFTTTGARVLAGRAFRAGALSPGKIDLKGLLAAVRRAD